MSEPAIELMSSPLQQSPSIEPEPPSVRLLLDQRAHAVSIDGRAVALTPREYQLLVYFSEHAGRLLTRRHLLQEVWGERYSGGPRTVDIHVSRLRRKLGTSLPLDTLRSLGYRFGSSSLESTGSDPSRFFQPPGAPPAATVTQPLVALQPLLKQSVTSKPLRSERQIS
jgi:DNA-binding winged helix-turn-helix (wHTH) protein